MADQHSSAPFIYPQGSFYEDLDNRIQALEAAIGTGGGAVPDYSITSFKIKDGAVIDEKLAEGAVTDSKIATSTRARLRSGLSGQRNQLINGCSEISQRASSQNTNGYGAGDRWFNGFVGTTMTTSVQMFPTGQIVVPGRPRTYARHVVSSVPGVGNHAIKQQRIESVDTLNASRATITFWARADASRPMAVELMQYFGTGGSASTAVDGIGAQKITLSTVWQKFALLVDIPPVNGKIIGPNFNDYLALTFWFDAGSNFNSRSANLGQQSGTFEITRASIVEGDATAEDDPYSARHISQEQVLCDRFYQEYYGTFFASAASGSATVRRVSVFFRTAMRAAPAVSWNSGNTFFLEERSTTQARWYSDPSNTNAETALGSLKLDAEL